MAALPAKRCISGGQGFRVAGSGRRWQAVAGGRSVAEGGRPRLRSNPPWPPHAWHNTPSKSIPAGHDMHHWPSRAKLRRYFRSCDLAFLALPAAIGLIGPPRLHPTAGVHAISLRPAHSNFIHDSARLTPLHLATLLLSCCSQRLAFIMYRRDCRDLNSTHDSPADSQHHGQSSSALSPISPISITRSTN